MTIEDKMQAEAEAQRTQIEAAQTQTSRQAEKARTELQELRPRLAKALADHAMGEGTRATVTRIKKEIRDCEELLADSAIVLKQFEEEMLRCTKRFRESRNLRDKRKIFDSLKADFLEGRRVGTKLFADLRLYAKSLSPEDVADLEVLLSEHGA